MIYSIDKSHNKMFNHLDQRDERQIRMQKSKIYKEMLDNQILLNQQYRRKQEAKRIAQQKSIQRTKNKGTSNQKPQSFDRSFQKQRQHKKLKKVVHLPTLQDKQTLYKGQSNYIRTPYPQSRRRIISRIQTQQINYDEQSSNQDSSKIEDIQQILIELKSLNKEVKKVKSNIKKKHLVNSSRKPRKQRQRKIDFSYNQNAQQSPDARMSKRYKSPSNPNEQENDNIQQSNNKLQRGKRMESLLYHSPRDKQKINSRNSTHQDKINTSDTYANDKSSDLQYQRRERFLQILRKVKNRGESLFIKLSKFPKN